MNILAEIKDEYGFDEQRKCFVEILYKVRDWDKGWNTYFETGKRPLNLVEFLDHLHDLYEIQKRVPHDTAN
jgi:hypothetical protein